MRPVNLLPAKHRPHQADGSKSGSAYVIVGVLAVLLLMAVTYVLETNKIAQAKTDTAAAEQKTAEARAKATANGPYANFAPSSRRASIRSSSSRTPASTGSARCASSPWSCRTASGSRTSRPRRTAPLTRLPARRRPPPAIRRSPSTAAPTASRRSPRRIIRLKQMEGVSDVTLDTSARTANDEKKKTTSDSAGTGAVSGCGTHGDQQQLRLQGQRRVHRRGGDDVDHRQEHEQDPGPARRWIMSMSERDKKILLALIPLALIAAFWFLVYSPKKDEATTAQTALETAQADQQTAESQAASVSTAKKGFADDYTTIVRLGKAVPANVDMPSLLVQLDRAARGTHISFDEITTGDRADRHRDGRGDRHDHQHGREGAAPRVRRRRTPRTASTPPTRPTRRTPTRRTARRARPRRRAAASRASR